jgi:hypothetical protein
MTIWKGADYVPRPGPDGSVVVVWRHGRSSGSAGVTTQQEKATRPLRFVRGPGPMSHRSRSQLAPLGPVGPNGPRQ